MIAMYMFGVATGWGTVLVLVQWERLQAERKAKRVRAEAEWKAYWQARLDAERK
jgi:hypothetical protein